MTCAPSKKSFLEIIRTTDPDCFLYNFAKQGEFDFGLWEKWETIPLPEGRQFNCFDDHVQFVESKLNLMWVQSWQPDSSWAVSDQVANFYLLVAKLMRNNQILAEDKQDAIDRISDLRLAHTDFAEIWEQHSSKPN